MPDHAELDERLLIAMRVARQHKLSIWDAALREHRGHPTFAMQGWPYTREYGFTCSCSGVEREWRIDLTCLKEMLPAARESVQRLYRQHMFRGTKKLRQQADRAEHRARALLHRYLTRSQRLELRKTRGFTMTGKDGRTYHVTQGSAGNIYLEHEGKKYILCVTPKDWNERIPTSDVMLAQKIMLETDPEMFLRLARVRCVTPIPGSRIHETYESGAFILGEVSPEKVKERGVEIIAIPNAVLEDPREWVEARVRQGQGQGDA